MSEYLIGDRRFTSIRRTRKYIVFTWTKKEFSNLKRAHAAGLLVPLPLVFDRNILIMEFLGYEEVPYAQLRNVELPDPDGVYQEVVMFIKNLYTEAELVHADLSEYNILYSDKPYVSPVPHLFFRIVPGKVEEWEVT